MRDELSILKYVKNLKGKWAICLLAVAGIMLLLLGGGMSAEKSADSRAELYSSEEYKAQLEGEVKTLCMQVSGDISPTVTVTLESGEEYVYATRADGSYITASGEAVLLYVKPPRVCGVAVVCRNGDIPEVKEKLTSLICALLNIGSNRVFVGDIK